MPPSVGSGGSKAASSSALVEEHGGLENYYQAKIDRLELAIRGKESNLRRLQAQRNEWNSKVTLLREEIQLLQGLCAERAKK